MGRRKTSNLNSIRAQVWVHKIFNLVDTRSTSDLDDKFFTSLGKNWYQYERGETTPSKETQNKVFKEIPEAFSLYKLGPYRIFEIIEAERIHDAVEIIQSEIAKNFNPDESNENVTNIKIEETPYIFEDSSYAKWLLGLGGDLYENRNTYALGDKIIPLAFATAYSESKFLGYNNSLIKLIDISLDYLEKQHGIKQESWFPGFPKIDSPYDLTNELVDARKQKEFNDKINFSITGENQELEPEDKELIELFQIFKEFNHS